MDIENLLLSRDQLLNWKKLEEEDKMLREMVLWMTISRGRAGAGRAGAEQVELTPTQVETCRGRGGGVFEG